MSVALGTQVRERRSKAGLSQRDLAAAIDVGAPYVSKIEAGRETPSVRVIARLAELFGCHPADIVADPDVTRAREWLRRSHGRSAYRDREAEDIVAVLVARLLDMETS